MSISFFEVLKNEKPLSVAGAINPYSALLAKKTGIKALYISGAGVANASFGLPDLALTSLDNVLDCLLYTSPSPRDYGTSRMPSSA